MNTPTYPPFSPYITVQNADKAIAFYQEAFGATERFRLVDESTGKIGHAELTLRGSLLMLSEENPAWSKSPKTLGGTPVKFSLMVENADAAMATAVTAGATQLMPPTDMFYGFRSASVRDPFGHEWMLQHEIEKVSPAEMQKRWSTMIKDCPASKEAGK